MAYADGSGLWYERHGSGDAVVLLHAGIVDSRAWEDVVPLLAERHTVVTYDQRGYGRSPAFEGPYSPVEDLRALLDELELERAALVGNSRGGKIALDFALAHPGRVGALVLVATAVGGMPLEFEADEELEARWEAAEERGDFAAMAEIDFEVWAPLGPDERLRRLVHDNAVASNSPDPEERLDPPAAERLSEVAAPTLVVTAADDIPGMTAIGDALERGIAGARRAVLEDCDHVVPLRQPEALARLILEHLAPAATGPK